LISPETIADHFDVADDVFVKGNIGNIYLPIERKPGYRLEEDITIAGFPYQVKSV
jgi:hypothetical protein